MRALRADLGVVAGEAGFSAFDYEPADPKNLPAAVVGGIKSMERLNAHVTQIQIGITFFVNAANEKDATARLDLALSTGLPNSFIELLDSVSIEDGPAWRSVRFESAGPYLHYVMPSGGPALAVEITLEFTA